MFKLNSDGVGELLRSPEMLACCREYAEQVRDRAGDGFEISEYTGKSRVNVSVYADTEEARRAVLDDNVLLRALGG